MFRNQTVISFFGLSVLLVLASAAVIFLGLQGKQGPFIIHFSQYGQIVFKGGLETVFTIVGVTGILTLMNFVLAYEIYSRERFLSYILAAGSFFVAILTLILSWTIISVN
ncbi:MAG: hypothetical protein HYW37_01335 [Candidatus Colwellbacteria bacterium]|nr:hypothetical protein [Candidatus Colwellbacteria bacterium]